MREETIKIYKFDELSEKSKEHARDEWRAADTDIDILWQSETLESFKKVFETAGIKINDYQLGMDRSYVEIDLDKDTADLTGARAVGWLENNLLSKLRVSRAEYLKNRKSYFKFGYRVDAVKDCPLTGYGADNIFLDELLKNVRLGLPLGESFKLLADCYSKLIQADYEYQNSNEYIDEHLTINDYEFTEDGDFY